MATYTLRNVLVPVDLSDAALNAAEMAGIIARATGAALHLLHVREWLLPADTGGTNTTMQSLLQKDILQALAARLESKYTIKTTLTHAAGTVVETILQTAGKKLADLVVMGKHGASGTRDGFAGHNTYHTIKYSPLPVLVVPENCPQALFPHVIYPFRLMEGAQMHHDLILPFITEGATVELLSVAQQIPDVPHRALHDFSAEVLEKCSAKRVELKLAQGISLHIGRELVQYAGRNDCTLVVINSALDMSNNPMFIGPHTQVAINELRNPLLFLPLNTEEATKRSAPGSNRYSLR